MVDISQPCLCPHVGVGVIVTRGQKVLFGKRIVKANKFQWQLPGGWLESGETLEHGARREVREETGLELAEPRFVAITNNIFSELNHSISLYFEAECLDFGSIGTIESKKCQNWTWKDWCEVSDNLYLPLQKLKNTDYRPFLTDKHKDTGFILE